VRGGGRKPYRQKGTGAARRGSQRSPLLVGGGAIFGPRPHDYVIKINKKVKQLARKSALSYKAKESAIVVVEDFKLEQIKTKEIATVLKNLGLEDKKTLFLTAGKDEVIYKSGRNIPYLTVLEAQKASTYDILNCKTLLLQKSAVKVLEENLSMN
jgi:large subunit ribosomal protein L4